MPALAKEQICCFVRHFPSISSLDEIAIPIITSTFFLDVYPPDMHCKFQTNFSLTNTNNL
jgi:hypothetical protein